MRLHITLQDKLVPSLGSIGAESHEWDDDPASWVREQRRVDERRVG